MRYSLALFLVFLTLSKGESKCYSRGSCKGDKEDVLAGIASFLDCHKTCRGREQCQWFTHNEATKTCFLFSNCPDIDENCMNCVTSEKMCPYFPAPGEPNKLLVIGGNWNDSMLADTTEVFDLDDPMARCKVVEFNPARSSGAIGGLIYGTDIVTCGGYPGYTEDCFKLGSEEPYVTMIEARDNAASLPLDYGTKLWVTGGFAYGTDSHLSSTTEFVSLDGSSQYGPDLPVTMDKHCMVQINSSTIMFTGGYIHNGNTKATFYYDIDSQTFTTGPDSLKHREYHACGLVKDKGDGSSIVVMMGTNNGASTTSSEFLVEGSGEWVEGPEFPYPVGTTEGITAADGERFIVVGGWGRSRVDDPVLYSWLFEFQCTNRVCQWNKMEQELSKGRSNHVLMLIPDSLVYCEP